MMAEDGGAGRKKIISEENLEVLALGTTGAFEDGLTLKATLEAIRRHPDTPVQWFLGGRQMVGQRGKILEGVMAKRPRSLF